MSSKYKDLSFPRTFAETLLGSGSPSAALYRVFHRGEPWPRGCFQGRFLGYVLFCSDFALRNKHILTPRKALCTRATADCPLFHVWLCVERNTRRTPLILRLLAFACVTILFCYFTLKSDGILQPYFILLGTKLSLLSAGDGLYC